MRRRDPYLRLRALARRFGYDLLRSGFYSPVPAAWEQEWWDRPAEMPGVDLRLDQGAALMAKLRPYIEEYHVADKPPGTAHGFHLDNNQFPEMDARVLYAMVRHLAPERLVELGAGWSSKVIADAGSPSTHRIFDPYPAPHLGSLQARVEPIPVEEIQAAVFADLNTGDILFIDTTHTVRPGNDVLRLVLEILPTLAPGVIVHIHDIFLPYSYPKFLYDAGAVWQEQWLVQALLVGSDRFEVLLANYALSRHRPDAVGKLAPGSSLWLRTLSP